jgi:hypothetical protein
MRRAFSLFLLITSSALLAISSVSLTASQAAVQVTLPGTNTPLPFVFTTNTPVPATLTPSLTPTETLTPSLTPSLTPTFTETPSPTLTPSPTPTLVGPATYPDGFNPLTGLPYPSDEAMNRRNLLIKISNYPPIVRPQSGVNQADVVYEYEVEGGVTRFAAIFRSNSPDHVGPIRSGRLMDLNLVPMYEALFSYSGASAPVQKLILSQSWRRWVISPSIGDNCEEAGFCRFPKDGVAFEHTLYADTSMIWARATARGVNEPHRARGFAFSDVADPSSEKATDIDIAYYGQIDAYWQYRADTGHYVRYTDQLPHMDAADGQQLWADNVVVIEVPHVERPDLFEEESKSASQDIQLWGQGRAYVFRDGQYYEGYWKRDCRGEVPDPTPTPVVGSFSTDCYARTGDALQLIFGDNTPIHLKPGRTWVMVTRWMNYVTIGTDMPDMDATAAMLVLTPTNTPWPTPTRTATPAS